MEGDSHRSMDRDGETSTQHENINITERLMTKPLHQTWPEEKLNDNKVIYTQCGDSVGDSHQ